MSKGQSQPRTYPTRRGLGRCKSKIIEIIDVDNVKADVVIIDASESSHHGSECSTTKYSGNPAVVIQIDDEEGDFDATPSNAGQSFTNNRACPLFDGHPFEKGLDNDECLIFHRRGVSPSNLRSNAHAGFGSSTGRYGLYSSETSSSESDSSGYDTYEKDGSDCEIMEDSSGLIREQWERAATRRKMSQKVKVSCDDQASASGSSADPVFSSTEPRRHMVDLDDCMNESSSEHFEASVHKCGPNCSNNGKYCTFNAPNSNEHSGDSYLGNSGREFHTDSDIFTGINCEGPSFEKEKTFENSVQRDQFSEADTEGNKICTPKVQTQGNIHFTVDDFNFRRENEKVPSGNSSSTSTNLVDDFTQGEPCPGKPSEASGAKHSVSDSAGLENQKEDVLHKQPSHDTSADQEVIAEAKEKPFVEQTPPFSELQHDESQMSHGNYCCSYDVEATHGESTSRNNARNEASSKNISLHTDGPDLPLSKGNAICHLEEPSVPQVQSDITGDREKHKESDDYKRANEEEWASRMREIQIQSEEAQRLRRLRKRRKAESLRLLDMEKRQKQRVEEIRESQRKDEEIINLKEVLRTEVRKELDKMELRYRDMASLLRGLGIHVEGGPFPLLHDVNAAYKQALLRFHPDRTSRSDIRKQVEAEETFKMISRLKEKLMPVS